MLEPRDLGCYFFNGHSHSRLVAKSVAAVSLVIACRERGIAFLSAVIVFLSRVKAFLSLIKACREGALAEVSGDITGRAAWVGGCISGQSVP